MKLNEVYLDNGTLVQHWQRSEFRNRSTGDMAIIDNDSFIPRFNGLPHESLDEYMYDVQIYIHGTKAEERKLCVPCSYGGLAEFQER